MPDLGSGEVEIARVSLESTLGDDISIRARNVTGGIEYLVVDDYGTNYVVGESIRPNPLSLGDLIELIDTVKDIDHEQVGLTDAFRERNYAGGDPDYLVGFVWVRSPFYPDLETYYETRAHEWAEKKRLEYRGGSDEG